jgi:hypothetical protein
MPELKDPFTGNWILNREKSNFDVNHAPRIATMVWERTTDGYRMRAEGENEDGQTVVDQTAFILDCQEHPLAHAPDYTAFSEQIDSHTLRSIGLKDGKVVGEGLYAVSEDGLTLTATVRGVDAQNRPFQTLIVWDRQ